MTCALFLALTAALYAALIVLTVKRFRQLNGFIRDDLKATREARKTRQAGAQANSSAPAGVNFT
jgi:hypothetical protein